ncbi:MAG: D-2-hydroxyacid dehydrogenase [Candidatus Rokubacteria bacterium]|nr:D-2-hydroxyacid dehydrogenase [Candidatus Rokubacteria bacterium]
MSARTVLVYHPAEAGDYAARVHLPRRGWALAVCGTPAEAEAAIESAEILYGWAFPAPLLARAPRLRWIQSMGAGAERFLVPELSPAVRLTRVAGIFGPWMAEYVLGWLLWTTQRIETFRARQRARQWIETNPERLRGRTLAIVGLGDIGREIGRAARAFGMVVIGVSRRGRRVPGVDRVYRTRQLSRALARADYVVLALPLTDDTRGLVGVPQLGALKPTAWLVNIGRGPLVQEAALVEALRERRLAGAVLDVFDTEPLPADHPLWGLDNVAITPHISGPSTPDEVSRIFNENLRRYLAGLPLRHLVARARGY